MDLMAKVKTAISRVRIAVYVKGRCCNRVQPTKKIWKCGNFSSRRWPSQHP